MFFCKQGASCTLIYHNSYMQSYTCTPTTLFSTPHKTNRTYLSTFKGHFPIAPNYHNLHFSTPTDTLHINYKTKLASLHFKCMAMLTVNGWILHLNFTLCCTGLLLSGPCIHLTLCLSRTIAYHTLHAYALSLIVKVCALAA